MKSLPSLFPVSVSGLICIYWQLISRHFNSSYIKPNDWMRINNELEKKCKEMESFNVSYHPDISLSKNEENWKASGTTVIIPAWISIINHNATYQLQCEIAWNQNQHEPWTARKEMSKHYHWRELIWCLWSCR